MLLNQVGIQFIHSGIQPYNGNAQISINSIPRCNEHTDMIRYYHVKASNIDCASKDNFADESPFNLKFPEPYQQLIAPPKKVRRQGTPRKCIHQFESEQDNDQNITPNLRNFIAATGLVILPKSDPNRRFFGPRDLKLWRVTLKRIGNFSHASRSYVCHFITIREFGFELQSRNTHIIANCHFFSCQCTHNFCGKFRGQIVS